MPAIPVLELVSVVGLLEAYLLGQADKKPGWPSGAGEADLSDEALWDLMVAAGKDDPVGTAPELRSGPVDLLAGLPFDVAVATDVRRIEALADARVTNDFYRALTYLHTGDVDVPEMLKHAYFLRNAALREMYGHVTLEGILQARQQQWEYFGQVLDVALAMRRVDPRTQQPTEAMRFWDAAVANLDAILSGFTEATEIFERAALVAADPAHGPLWLQCAAITQNMRQAFVDKFIQLGVDAVVAQGGTRTRVPAVAPAQPPAQLTEGGDQPGPAAFEPEAQPVEEGGEDEGDEEAVENDEGFGSLFGYDSARTTDFAVSQALAGHRAAGFDLPQARRAGARW